MCTSQTLGLVLHSIQFLTLGCGVIVDQDRPPCTAPTEVVESTKNSIHMHWTMRTNQTLGLVLHSIQFLTLGCGVIVDQDRPPCTAPTEVVESTKNSIHMHWTMRTNQTLGLVLHSIQFLTLGCGVIVDQDRPPCTAPTEVVESTKNSIHMHWTMRTNQTLGLVLHSIQFPTLGVWGHC